MYSGPLNVRSARRLARGLIAGLIVLVGSAELRADTSFRFQRNATPTCYCRCGVSQVHGGCAKMCETARFASRWWATSCAKPRRKPNANPSKAGPRLPHPGRAEHAQLVPLAKPNEG